ncbi:Glucose-1-phosphate adenylyltransferase [hydrothermal vent metagenome]|uniref:Glucose-1-phosphate adenylyltransferase n=1 Tax=hydrothermal vent metagenome TaxID=652676 RepID=A0A3B0RDG9_9ZZZZ
MKRLGIDPSVLSIVLAGGMGKRLLPLTAVRAKPAVPHAGQYRLIDFALSNLANGGFRRIVVLTQYKSHSLDVHISTTWRMSTFIGNYVTSVPAQMRRGPRWFEGSADALFQNMNLIDDEQPKYIFVFGADHIYRMDPNQMLHHHIDSGAGVTVAGIRVPIDQASQFGVIERGADSSLITAFREKPSDAKGLPDNPEQVLASMGNYVFTTDVLIDILNADAASHGSGRDIGGDIIPALVSSGEAHVYDFFDNIVPGETPRDQHYWRDVGTLDSYYAANMDLVDPHPIFNLYNDDWPVFTGYRTLPPAKIVAHGEFGAGRVANSMVSGGSIITGATVEHSVISPNVRIEPGAVVENAIIFDDVVIGAGAVVKNAIIDKKVVVPRNRGIGVDADRDREDFTVSDEGIIAIGKGEKVSYG